MLGENFPRKSGPDPDLYKESQQREREVGEGGIGGGQREEAQSSSGAGVRERAKVRGVRRASEQTAVGRWSTNVPHCPMFLGPLFSISIWRLQYLL